MFMEMGTRTCTYLELCMTTHNLLRERVVYPIQSALLVQFKYLDSGPPVWTKTQFQC